LLLGERSPDAVPGAVDAPPGTARVLALNGRRRRSRAVPGSRWSPLVNEVAGAATADVVDGSLVLHHAALTGELLVEAEDGALALTVDVAGAATAGGEERVGWMRSDLRARCRAGGGWAWGDFLGVHLGDIACTAAARVNVPRPRDGRVRLGDVICFVRRHYDVTWCCVVSKIEMCFVDNDQAVDR